MNASRRTQQTYAQIAADYAAANVERQKIQKGISRFANLLPKDALVLDVGCGQGYDTAVLGRLGLRVVGLDYSIEMMKTGQIQADFVQADMVKLPFPRRANGIWACASFLHIPREEASAALEGFARVLLPGGILCLSVKQGEGEGWSEISYGHRAPRYFVYWQPRQLDEALETAGFEIIDGWTDPANKGAWLVRFGRING